MSSVEEKIIKETFSKFTEFLEVAHEHRKCIENILQACIGVAGEISFESFMYGYNHGVEATRNIDAIKKQETHP